MNKNYIRKNKLNFSLILICIILIIIIGALAAIVQNKMKQNIAPIETFTTAERDEYIKQKDKKLEEKVNPTYVNESLDKEKDLKENFSKEYQEYLDMPENEREKLEVIPSKYDVEYSELDKIIEKENAYIENNNTANKSSNNYDKNNVIDNKIKNNVEQKANQNSQNNPNIQSKDDKQDEKKNDEERIIVQKENKQEFVQKDKKEEKTGVAQKEEAQEKQQDVVQEENKQEEQQEINQEENKQEEQQEINQEENKQEEQQEINQEEKKQEEKKQEEQQEINQEENKQEEQQEINQEENKQEEQQEINQEENKQEEQQEITQEENKKEEQQEAIQEENKKEEQQEAIQEENNKQEEQKEIAQEEVKQQETISEENSQKEKLPAKFNLNDIIDIEVEDQREFGLCWNFSSLKCLETNIAMTKGLKYNFSEIHMDYATSELLSAEARRIHQGSVIDTFIEYVNSGKGPVLDELLEYRDYSKEEYIAFTEMNKDGIVITDYVEFPTYRKYMNWSDDEFEKYQNTLKKHIMNFGGIIMDTTVQEIPEPYWFYKSENERQTDVDAHNMLIVGWDDNFPKEKFTSPSGAHPEKDGAYIVLNSWGKKWGDNGYLYISYEDSEVHSHLKGIISTDKENLIKLSDINNKPLEQFIKKEYNNYVIINNGIEYISKASFVNVYQLDLSGLGLNNLNGIELFNNINILNLSSNNLKDISNLEELQHLLELNINDNPNVDLSAIANMTKIAKLSARNCNIDDASILQNNFNFKYLDLSENPNIKNLGKINSRQSLELKLNNCNVTDLDFLKYNHLKSLDLSNNTQIKFEQLQEKSFKELYLRNCNIQDASVLQNIKASKLDLSENKGLYNIDKLQLVTNLVLEDCNLNEIPNILDLKLLKYLSVANNNIKDVNIIQNTGITELDVSGNKGIQGNLKNSKINYLKVNNCDINNEFDFFGITDLEAIEVKNNNVDLDSLLNKINFKNIEISKYNYNNLSNISDDIVIENTTLYSTIKIPSGKYKIFLNDLFEKNLSKVDIKYSQGVLNKNFMYIDVNAFNNFTVELIGINSPKNNLVNCNLVLNFEIDNNAQPTGIIVTKLPNKLSYTDGEKLDYTGLEVSEIYGEIAYKLTNNYDLQLDSKNGDNTSFKYGSNKVNVAKDGFECHFSVMYYGMEDSKELKFRDESLYNYIRNYLQDKDYIVKLDDKNKILYVSEEGINYLAKARFTLRSSQIYDIESLKDIDFKELQIDFTGTKIDTNILINTFPNLESIIVYKKPKIDSSDVVDEQDELNVIIYNSNNIDME